MTTCQEFATIVRERLEGRHGLRFVESREIGWTCYVEFANETTGVVFDWETRIDVLFGPLVDGRLASSGTGSGSTRSFESHYLSGLLEVLGADSTIGDYDMSEDAAVARRNVLAAVDRVLAALERHATAIIGGDFSMFPRLDAAAGARAAEDLGRPAS